MSSRLVSIAVGLLVAAAMAACGAARSDVAGPVVDSATPVDGAGDPAGRWHVDLPGAGTYQELVLTADHHITGYDGCNSLTGRWSVDRSDPAVARVRVAGQSYKACPGLGVADLSAAVAASVVDGHLRLTDASGSLVASL